MSEETEQKLLTQIQQLQKEVRELKGVNEDAVPIYKYSTIRDSDLEKLVRIEKKLDYAVFEEWFNYEESVDDKTIELFETLIDKNRMLVEIYSEEDLKVNFIVPILNRVEFRDFENEFRDFYELPMRYETEEFIFSGTTDFVVSKGLVKSKKEYFFIQEFKKGKSSGYPEPQLLAELISAVELNSWETIKGAYIVGAIWHFVILKRLKRHTYHYFVSKSFDALRIEDLKEIYKNLLFVKEEITEMIKKENSE